MAKTETTELSFYNGETKVLFYPNSHRYKLIEDNGEVRKDWIPSPSAIIGKLDKSTQLVSWAVRLFHEKVTELMRDGVSFTKSDVEAMIDEGKNAHRLAKESACTIGSIVHDFAERNAKEGLTDITNIDGYNTLSEEEKTKALAGAQAFIDWKINSSPKFLQHEFSVFSRKEKFVGTLDALISIEGKKYLADYKTSKDIYTSHLYQVASYLKAYEEEYNEKLEGGLVLKFDKETGEFKPFFMSRLLLVKAYKVFKALQVVYEGEKEMYKVLKDNLK